MACAIDELLRRAGGLKKEDDDLEHEASQLSTQIAEKGAKLRGLEERRAQVIERLIQVKARRDVSYFLHLYEQRRAADLSATEIE
jgi:hypothetical protein